jgi:hypothetical protein
MEGSYGSDLRGGSLVTARIMSTSVRLAAVTTSKRVCYMCRCGRCGTQSGGSRGLLKPLEVARAVVAGLKLTAVVAALGLIITLAAATET